MQSSLRLRIGYLHSVAMHRSRGRSCWAPSARLEQCLQKPQTVRLPAHQDLTHASLTLLLPVPALPMNTACLTMCPAPRTEAKVRPWCSTVHPPTCRDKRAGERTAGSNG